MRDAFASAQFYPEELGSNNPAPPDPYQKRNRHTGKKQMSYEGRPDACETCGDAQARFRVSTPLKVRSVCPDCVDTFKQVEGSHAEVRPIY